LNRKLIIAIFLKKKGFAMNFILNKKLFLKAMLTVFGAAGLICAQQLVDGWSLTLDNSRNVSMMSVTNPKTYLNIEDEININLNNQGIPISGTVNFKDGVNRDLKQGEVSYYWEVFNGQHALWDYLATLGKLVTINPQTESIPTYFLGKMTKVVTKTNVELFGKLGISPEASDSYILQIDGASGGPVHFEKYAVTIIQQVK
jgi:hypothetical protein